MASASPAAHIAIFPFMSKGHTLPVISLTHLLLRRRLATVTFFTTPMNAPFIRSSLSGTDADIIELPFPDNIPGLPAGVESTDQLPSLSLFLIPFLDATKKLRPHLEQALERMPTISFLISDQFLAWTKESASKYGVPRIVFSGMNNFSTLIICSLVRYRPHVGVVSHDVPLMIPGFPHVKFTKADVGPPFDDPDFESPLADAVKETTKASMESYGVIVNSFYEMEAAYFDYMKKETNQSSWCIGPLCLARPAVPPVGQKPAWIHWLDLRLVEKKPVLYIAFGTQEEVSISQLQEIAIALEKSGLEFLWVVRNKEADLGEGFEERVADRGRVIREWVDQVEILGHHSVKGFMSHCGWNSVLESICAGVPILAWPMMAEQFLNAKLVAEELEIGLRIHTVDGKCGGWVKHEDIESMARELLLGEKGRLAREKVKGISATAVASMDDGGTSWKSLKQMIDEVCKAKTSLDQNRGLKF